MVNSNLAPPGFEYGDGIGKTIQMIVKDATVPIVININNFNGCSNITVSSSAGCTPSTPPPIPWWKKALTTALKLSKFIPPLFKLAESLSGLS